MSIKQPIYHEFDLNATSGSSRVISLTHTDDAHVDVIELCVKQQGAPADLTGATVIARMVLHKTPPVLLSDSVTCTVNDAGNILIPFDNAAVQTRKGIVKIEVNITRTPDILTLQLPLWVKINGSILDDATVDPHSEGTIPELLKDAADALEEATQALEDAKDYDKLENKPQINSVTLSGNQSSDDLGLQKKLTAGTNITIENDGTISASGGVTSYNNLTDKPTVQVNGSQIVPLSGKLMFTSGFYLANYLPGELIRIELSNVSRSALENWQNYLSGTQIPSDNYFTAQYDFNNLRNPQATGEMDFTDAGFFKCIGKCLVNTPQAFSSSIGDNSRVMIIHFNTIPINEQFHYLLRVIYFQDSITNKIRQFTQWIYFESEQDTTVHNVTDWCEIGGSQIVSGIVNQNGTITFTDSDGNTFTTSGSSVIGFSPTATVTQTASGATVTITDKNGTTAANISNGADGQDYVLTSQDKTDIANIVLQLLPTTQGVQYGNANN